MKIYIIEPFEEGAMIQVAHMLGNALSGRGHDVRVAGSGRSEISDLHRDYELVTTFAVDRRDRGHAGASGAVRVARRTVWKAVAAVQFVTQYARTALVIRRERADFVIVSTVFRYPLIRWLLLLARSRGTTVVQICHEYQLREERPSFSARLLRRSNDKTYGVFGAIVMLSEYQHTGFQQAFPDIEAGKLALIPLANGDIFREYDGVRKETGRPLSLFGGTPLPDEYVLFFGRLRPDKGVEDLIVAFGSLEAAPPLVLAGHATVDFQERLEQLAAKFPSVDLRLHPSYVDSADVWELVEGASMVVLPYRSASQSAALQVAMSAGRPVVATRAGGLVEVVIGGVTGTLVDPQEPGQLANAIAELLDDPALAARMGEAAATLAHSEYDWATFAERLESQVMNGAAT